MDVREMYASASNSRNATRVATMSRPRLGVNTSSCSLSRPLSGRPHSSLMPLQTVVQRNIDNFSRDIISLRRCYQCGYTPGSGSGDDESRALKRCAGCAQAIYCSAECQRSAWKSHK